MKIELQTIGINKLKVINLLRRYGRLSMIRAREISENLPAEFESSYPYEKIDEIMDAFAKAGCTISIETGHRKPKKKRKSHRISRILFSKMKDDIKEDKENIKLSNKEEVIAFLKNRQDLPKAIGTGIIALFSLWVMFGSYFFKSDFILTNPYKIAINLIIALIIGLSVRMRGRGVEKKFGTAAAMITVFTSIGIFYLFRAAMVYREDFSLSYFFTPFDFSDYWYSLSMLGAGLFSFFVAFENINEKPLDPVEIAKESGKGASEIISIKTQGYRKVYTAPHKDYFKSMEIKEKEETAKTEK